MMPYYSPHPVTCPMDCNCQKARRLWLHLQSARHTSRLLLQRCAYFPMSSDENHVLTFAATAIDHEYVLS